MENFVDFSLLYPSNKIQKLHLNKNYLHWIDDLHIQTLLDELSIDPIYRPSNQALLTNLITDIDVIRYRQNVLKDFMSNEQLASNLPEILEIIRTLKNYTHMTNWRESQLRLIAWRVGELESFVNCVVMLHDLLSNVGESLQSDGLKQLQDIVSTIVEDVTFQHLQGELPDMIKRIRGNLSVTIGVNLNDRLQPVEATLLSVNQERFVGSKFMFRLFGKQRLNNTEDDEYEGIGPLHSALKILREQAFKVSLYEKESPLLIPLFRDLAEILEQSCKPIARALQQYTGFTSALLVRLETEFAFYLGAIQLMQRLSAAGMSMSVPEVLPMTDRICELKGLYNVDFALQKVGDSENDVSSIVDNDVTFNEEGRIFVLTGPNRGGKTTYVRAIGLAQILMQAGLYVPAITAKMSPVDNIYTHFASTENPEIQAGRLGEEAKRIHEIFSHTTKHSLILLNESFASTSAEESLFLAREVVLVMRLLGVRAIFTTHLHELAADVDSINSEVDGESCVISMISLVEIEESDDGEIHAKRTFKIVPGEPMGKSYAQEIAVRYGISFRQLTDMLKQRKQLPSN